MTSVKSTISATPGWPIYRALVGIGLICALVIVTVFEVTLPVIELNKKQALENAIYQVLPNAKSFAAYTVDSNNQFQPTAGDSAPVIYACFDANRALIGFAIPAQGMGYQDSIDLLYGYATERRSIEGLAILQNRETPGLGGKIGDGEFLQNFSSIKVSLEHPLTLIKNAPKTQAWQIDAITGATVSSQAVVTIMNRSLLFWIPLITRNEELVSLEH